MPTVFCDHPGCGSVITVFAEDLARCSKNFRLHGGGILPCFFEC